MSSSQLTLRLGTRGSRLATMQSQLIADALMQAHPGLKVQTLLIQTTGDRVQGQPLNEIGGKGLFTKELEQALLANKIDFAVHSFKDVPITMPLIDVSDLVIAATPAREDVRDVLVGAARIGDLAKGSRVGTGSLRRRCQLLDQRPDLDVQMIRGNVDTRLRKQREGQIDAVILALAGLKRSHLYDESQMTPIGLEQMLPAAGQGALAIQCRRADSAIQQVLGVLNDPATAACVDLEREVVRQLNGDCHSPIAALATTTAQELHLRVAVGQRDGSPPVKRAEARGLDASSVLAQVMQQLSSQ
ncbi:MAG TPA: hydroxymethylbilane synthase [Tepidisphaeraceae bacterium]|nr:hydroxymethylbilane synthase [Tepidisphaeraceae bacterium]